MRIRMCVRKREQNESEKTSCIGQISGIISYIQKRNQQNQQTN